MKAILYLLSMAAFAINGCFPERLLPDLAANSDMMPTVTPAVMIADPSPESETLAAPIPIGWQVESFVRGLQVPWSIIFTAPDRMLVSERKGTIREIINGSLNPVPVFEFEDVTARGEAGLMGLAVDPGYQKNGFIYACYTTTDGGIGNRIMRLKDDPAGIVRDAVIFDDLPAANNHAGCRIRFGQDGKLYATIGDALEPPQAQDLNSLAGKILRLNPDGSIPEDNPFPGSAVWSYGHRNPQGIDWQPNSGRMFSSEHGPSGFDGPQGGDELNLIEKGGNYGWPLVSHELKLEGTMAPLAVFTPAEAPASLVFYNSDVLPMFKGNLFFGALRGKGLMRIILDDNEPEKVAVIEKIIDDVGRVRDVVQGPDGSIYFSTSNRDGRGTPNDGDDHIFRIIPVY